MNERIKELMLMAFQEHYGNPITPVAREKAVELVSGWGEKFAELIIKECASIDFRHKIGLTSDQDYEVSSIIKEHFGVKE